MIIYLDESGDLGFDFTKAKTTKKFVITLLVCNKQTSQKHFKKDVRRTLEHRINRKKKQDCRIQELKGAKTSIEIKKYFFKQLKIDDWSLYTVVLNKKRVEKHLRTKTSKSKLYNFLARFLIEKLPLRTTFTNVKLVVDRSKNRDEIKDFNQYVQHQIEALLPLNTSFTPEHLNSHENAGLQAVDLFCWGIFRKYEIGDCDWYRTYSSKIRYETEYLPPQNYQ